MLFKYYILALLEQTLLEKTWDKMQASKIGFIIAGLIMVLAAFLTYSYGIETILFFLILAGMCFYLGLSKGRTPAPYERYAKFDRTIDSLPPEQRKEAGKTVFLIYALSLYFLSLLTVAYVILYHEPLSENFLIEFFNDPITPVLLLMSASHITAGELLRRNKKLGGFFAIGAYVLLITSLILIATKPDDSWPHFVYYTAMSGTGLPFLYKFWKDLEPLRLAN